MSIEQFNMAGDGSPVDHGSPVDPMAGRRLTMRSIYQMVGKELGLPAWVIRWCFGRVMLRGGTSVRLFGKFNLAGMVMLKKKVKPAKKAKIGVHPFTKEGPHVFKAKPASNTVIATPLKKLKKLVNTEV